MGITLFATIAEQELEKREYLRVIHNYVNYDSQFRCHVHLLQLDTCERMYENLYRVMETKVLEIIRDEH